jgi:mono/diheme cytochrome c family protein
MKLLSFISIITLFVFISCESKQLPSPPKGISDVEAYYVKDSNISINSGWWDRKNFTNITLSNQVTGIINSEPGVLNVNGTYNGLASFNNGDTAGMTVQALYNDKYLYILVEWADLTTNASAKNWKYQGKTDPLKPSELALGWSSQFSSDNLYFHFSNEDGSSKDIWQWSAALSAPIGYALDKHVNNSGDIVDDSGIPMYLRNSIDATNTGGPKYEWGGNVQNVLYPNGSSLALDPAFYLIDTVSFKGNIVNGESIYNAQCVFCHGKNGSGEQSDEYPEVYGVALNSPTYARYSRSAIIDGALADDHDGLGHFAPLSENSRQDLLAYLRGIQGIPGYILQMPTGSNADVKIESTFNALKIKSTNKAYKVMFVRKLDTGNADDIAFKPSDIYKLDISVSDNDIENSIGSNGLLVKFIKED